jgi:pyridoxamine 5'-phosphate oxidase
MADFAQPLREEDLDPDPIRQFAVWFGEATAAGTRAPEAAALATATPDGRPSVRMVLVKRWDEHGFVLFTNYESRKGQELAANPFAALMFNWDLLGRQVRIEGPMARTPADETAAYVRSRPRGSQLSAMASPQSRPVPSRSALEESVAELAARYEDQDLPVPGNWGGFRLTPESIEFWQHREDRLHDRLRFRRVPDGAWHRERLAP